MTKDNSSRLDLWILVSAVALTGLGSITVLFYLVQQWFGWPEMIRLAVALAPFTALGVITSLSLVWIAVAQAWDTWRAHRGAAVRPLRTAR